MKSGTTSEQPTRSNRSPRRPHEPAADAATLLARVREAVSRRDRALLRILRETAPTCQLSDGDSQEIVNLLATLPPGDRLRLCLRIARTRPARMKSGAWSKIVSGLQAAVERRTDWLGEWGLRLMAHVGTLDPAQHVHTREQLAAALQDRSRWPDLMPDLIFRMARKETEAPLLLFGMLTAEALARPPDGKPQAPGMPIVDALASLFLLLVKSKRRPVQPTILRAARSLIAQLERDAAARDEAVRNLAARHQALQAAAEERVSLERRIDLLVADTKTSDERIRQLEQMLAEERSRYALLGDASRGARQDALRGLLARLQRQIRHEMGDVLEAIGDPEDGVGRLIRARAQNVLALLDEEAKKVETS